MQFYRLADGHPGLTHGRTLYQAAADLGQSCAADPWLTETLAAGCYEVLLSWQPAGELEPRTVIDRTAAIRAAFGLHRLSRGSA